MEFKIGKSVLEKNLNTIVRLIPPKSTYTVLQNIILAADNNALSIEGTDLDIFVKKSIPAQVKADGKVLVPGKKILEIAREANAEELTFKLKELNLQIHSGNAHFNIPALDAQEFPEVPAFPTNHWFDVAVGDLSAMVDATVFMVSRDISRRPMNGILVQVKDGELRLVTTDGARLAFSKRQLKQKAGDYIIAPKVFELLDWEKPEEQLTIMTEERMIGFKYLDTQIMARLIEGPYPNYEAVIPKDFTGTCTVEKDILDGALKRVSLVANPNLKSVKFDFHEAGIVLSASSPDIGEAKEEVAAQYQGEKVGIWFNANFLLELSRHMNASEITIRLTSATTAAVMQPGGNDEQLYLLMPLRIDSYE